MVQQVANLLNVNIDGTETTKTSTFTRDEHDDDLTLLTGGKKTSKTQSSPPSSSSSTKKPKDYIPGDIRSKYADKLAKKGLQGGVATIELAKHQVEETLKGGDAGGHLSARAMATANPVSRTKSWMAMSGTGALLQYLTQRSIHIVLLPKPNVDTLNEEEGERMQDFVNQLHDVSFDHLFKDGTVSSEQLVTQSIEKLKIHPNRILLVSDRDDYLRAAKEEGLLTCRILPANARRGNISAHYVVPSVPEVQDVVNEINGISFNAIMKQGMSTNQVRHYSRMTRSTSPANVHLTKSPSTHFLKMTRRYKSKNHSSSSDDGRPDFLPPDVEYVDETKPRPKLDPAKYTHEIPVRMPDFGGPGKVLQWYKQEGDVVLSEDVLCDIETPDFVCGMETEDEHPAIMGQIIVDAPSDKVQPNEIICYLMHPEEDATTKKEEKEDQN
jgi:hypothetical protein